MMSAGIVYAELILLCLLVLGVILYKACRDLEIGTVNRKFYAWMIIAHIAAILIGSSVVLAERHIIGNMGSFTLTISHIVLDFSIYIASFCWVMYLLVTEDPKLLTNKRALGYWGIPFIMLGLLSLTSLYSPMLHFVDANGVLTEGPLFTVQQGVLLATEFFAGYMCQRNNGQFDDYDKRREMHIIALYPIVYAFFLGCYCIFHIPFLAISYTLALFIMYINQQDMRIHEDSLTRLNNRSQLFRHLEHKMEEDNKNLYVMMIDIDGFKKINDECGHVEGDAALIQVADKLKESVKKVKSHPFLARYGGDEFIIVMSADGEKEVKYLMTNIKQSIMQIYIPTRDHKGAKELSVSCGFAKYMPVYKKTTDLIRAADEQMYIEKNHSEPVMYSKIGI